MEKLTPQQLSDIRYFWEYKGDLERLSSFESLKPKLQAEYPEILKAWNDYKASIKTLDAVISTIPEPV